MLAEASLVGGGGGGGGVYVEAVKVVLMGSGQKGACNTKNMHPGSLISYCVKQRGKVCIT